ncbi:DUF952 domain-containing protein [Nocardioides marmoraquaticus]
MRIHHVATAADWREARRTGRYTTSTLGRTLEQEGFVHAARPEQVQRVYDAYYRDHVRRTGEPMVLLAIDTDRLDALGVPWREDPVGDTTYPHVYGAVPREAVAAALPLDTHGRPPSLTTLFLREALPPVGIAVVVMLVSGLGASLVDGAARLPLALVLLVVGGVVGWWGLRRARSR